MLMSLKILLFFAVGMLWGLSGRVTIILPDTDLGTYALYLLMFLVGIGIGADGRSFFVLKKLGIRVLVVPMATIIGTFTGILFVMIFIQTISLKEALAVGAGFGYYSLSSILISEIHSEALGVTALLSNITREVITLLLAPLMVTYFSKISPITAAGATSMDTTLPVITAVSGKEYAVISLFHGIVLTILVPLLVTFILWL